MKPARSATPIPAGFEARAAASALLRGVLYNHRPLDELLDGGPLAKLEGGDRALARAIAGASLRRLAGLRAAISPFLHKPLPQKSAPLIDAILLTAAAQILLMEVADYAAVSLAVEQARRTPHAQPFASLVNAVLRNLVREKDKALAGLQDVSREVPEWMQLKRAMTYGVQAAEAMAAMERVEPPLDITVKSEAAAWAERLGGVVLPNGTVRLIPQGPVTAMPGFEEGEWWVQDAAASLPVKLLGDIKGLRVADLCAAPGGKTAQLVAAGAHVTAVDRNAGRIARLSENLSRLRFEAETVVADAAEWQGGPFDAVLLDAPCSATGTIRRHPDVAWLKRPTDVTALAATQTRLLDAAVRMLKPGGTLLYATCSLEAEEGEAQIAALLERATHLQRDPIRPEELPGMEASITALGELRTLPHHLPHETPRLAGLDGFFAARIKQAS